MNTLPVLLKDGYKAGHIFQYPKDTTHIYSNLTPRASRTGMNEVVLFGLQYFMREYLCRQFKDNFFNKPLHEVEHSYKRRMDNYLGKDVIPFDHIKALHKLGYLPIHIKALPEGTLVPMGVPMLTIINTHKDFFWLTNMLETLMSSILWLPCTSATTAFEYKKNFIRYAKLTGGNKEFIPWQGHDFSFRGMSSLESALTSGAAHLLSFTGTDTIPAIDFLEEYYYANSDKELIGGSVAATEHSVMCIGTPDGELETFKRLITEVYPGNTKDFQIVSIVSDTWDLWKVVTEYLPKLKKEILARNGKVVIRPDCYDDKTEVLTNSGWKLFSNLTDLDLVAQVLDNETFEFVKPLKYYNELYSGEMIHFFDQKGKLDLLVTPNHRMVFKQSNILKTKEAKNTTFGSWGKDILRTVPFHKQESSLTALEKLAIAFQADGSYTTNQHNSIRFSFSKQRKIDRLLDIVKELELEYNIYKLSKNPKYPEHSDRVEIHIKNTNPSKDFLWVPHNPDSKWAKEFIEECSYWDATRRSDNRFKIDTTNEQVANTIENVALFAGYGCKHVVHIDDRKEIFSPVHTLHILKDNKLGGQSIDKEVITNYNGTIHCVQVPSGRIIVRRNNSTAVCGNSGDPVKIICGDPDASEECVKKGLIQCLWDIFGGTVNDKGFKTLDSHIGAIYGDSINLDRQVRILDGLKQKHFASDNIVLGIGSYTYQYVTRDNFGFAMKATCGFRESSGQMPIPIFKKPKTDDGTKNSHKGLLCVVRDNKGELECVENVTRAEEQYGLLTTVYKDGKITKLHTLANIRERLNGQL